MVFTTIITGIASYWAYLWEHKSIAAKADERLKVYIKSLESKLNQHRSMPFVIANDQRIKDLIETWEVYRKKLDQKIHITPAEIQILNLKKLHANTYLQQLQEKALMQKQRKLYKRPGEKHTDGEDILYILGHEGVAIAAGNWKKKQNYLGQRLGYAPYFLDAFIRGEGESFSLGVKQEKPSYFISSPILIKKKLAGVAAIQIDLTELQKDWEEIKEPILISDEYNVSILSGKRQWLWKTLKNLPETSLEDIRKQRRYRDKKLYPLASTSIGDIPENKLRIYDQYYYYHSTVLSMGKTNWTIYYFTPQSELTQRVWGAGIITAICGMMIMLLAVLRKFRRRDRQSKAVKAELKRQRNFNVRLEKQIAERERVERELRELQEEMIQNGKLSALGDMAAAMAHELNQPITALKMDMFNARKLIMSGKSESEVLPILTDMEELTDRMRRITEQLKAFARKEPLHLDTFELHNVIEDAKRLIKPQLSTYDCKLQLDLDDEPLIVEADKGRLEQVLINLMRNAIDAMQNEDERILSISTQQTASSILIRVKDTGTGIPQDQISHIFEPFYTTKSAGAGIGLGLAISKRIIENFKGKISIIDTPEGGACFEISLPVPEENNNIEAIAMTGKS